MLILKNLAEKFSTVRTRRRKHKKIVSLKEEYFEEKRIIYKRIGENMLNINDNIKIIPARINKREYLEDILWQI